MEYDKEKEKINKQKNILKKVSFIILALEAIFFTSEEIIDLAYTTEIPSAVEQEPWYIQHHPLQDSPVIAISPVTNPVFMIDDYLKKSSMI